MRRSWLACLALFPFDLMAQWTPLGGPEGGDIVAIVNAGSYLACSAADGDIFTSSNNGVQWVAKGKVSPPGSVVTQLAAAQGALFASTIGGGTASGLYRSTDDGSTWTQAFSAGYCRVSASGMQVFAIADNALFYSTNSGATWTDVRGNLPLAPRVAMVHGSAMFAGLSDSAVYRSTNNGVTWTRTWTLPLPSSVGILKSDGTTLYAGYERANAAWLARSTDNGTSWTTAQIIGVPRGIIDLLITPTAVYLPAVFQAGTAPWTAGVYVSTNNGSSWTLRNDGLIPRFTTSIVSAGSDVVVGTSGGGVFRSSNTGMTWSRSSGGLVKTWVNNLTFVSGGAEWYTGTLGGGFFVSSDSGFSWSPRNSGFENAYSTASVLQFAIRGSSWFAGTADDGLYKSTNNGASWSRTFLGVRVAFTGIATRGATDVFATQEVTDGVYRSTDDGESWDQIMSGSTTFAATCVAIGGAGTVFVGGSGGNVLRTTNNGTNWLSSPLGGGAVARHLRFVGNAMFAGTTNGVYRSTNFGVAWSPSNTGMTGVEVDFIAIQDTATLFASSRDSGMYVSTNNGTTWRASNQGLPTLRLRGVRSTGTHLYVATVGYGVWRRPVDEVITDVRESGSDGLPSEFMLAQNYPNPFNPSTKIAFSIPVGTGHAPSLLKVYDVLGREVATLVNEVKAPGHYEVTWDAEGLASGVYFYKLQADNFAQTKKLLLLR